MRIVSTTAGQTDANLYYAASDYLGSISGLMDETGAMQQEYSYDAWGARRDPATWQNYTQTQLTTYSSSLITDRGYTGHEMLDLYGLINMNGRMYDPLVGRFLSADPVIQSAGGSQGYNAYSYALNNPLKYTDPTGYSYVGAGTIPQGAVGNSNFDAFVDSYVSKLNQWASIVDHQRQIVQSQTIMWQVMARFGFLIGGGSSSDGKGRSFIIVPSKDARLADRKSHGFFSAYMWDYRKAKRMERKGVWKVIERDNVDLAVQDIIESLGQDEYVENLVIDFHRSNNLDNNPFSNEGYEDGTVEFYLGILARKHAGKETTVYLGMCWSGGNEGFRQNDMTRRTSEWLGGATVIGHQAEASSLSFVLFNHFSGFTNYDKRNTSVKGINTVSYYDEKIGQVRTVEVRAKAIISAKGSIIFNRLINLSEQPAYELNLY
ncbi:MAG: RHS repeat domain-containing protein [Bacteroidales bacterium]